MIEIIILVILVLFYIIPYKGFVKLSAEEQRVIDDYKHINLKLTDNSEDLIASDIGIESNLDLSLDKIEGDNTPTLSVLGNINDSNEEDCSDVQIKDLF